MQKIPVETIPGLRERRDKGEQLRGGGELKYDIFDTL
jgi:hypothetical protein